MGFRLPQNKPYIMSYMLIQKYDSNKLFQIIRSPLHGSLTIAWLSSGKPQNIDQTISDMAVLRFL